MAYTPELSDEASCTLRRIAWAVNRPMTKTMDLIFTDLLLPLINREWVCERCRDSTRCALCAFSETYKEETNAGKAGY